MAPTADARGFSFGRFVLYTLLAVAALGALYFAVVLNWSYSSGERAGWVQKFSKKGWLCKTWEGEIALVSMPGAIPEKFEFTVTDDAVAERINRLMGRRVSLHYEQRVGLPTACFGETRYFVTGVTHVEDIPLAPGVVVPSSGPAVPAPPPGGAAGGMPASPVAPAPVSPSGAPAPGAPPAPAPAPAQVPSSGSTPGLPSMPSSSSEPAPIVRP